MKPGVMQKYKLFSGLVKLKITLNWQESLKSKVHKYQVNPGKAKEEDWNNLV